MPWQKITILQTAAPLIAGPRPGTLGGDPAAAAECAAISGDWLAIPGPLLTGRRWLTQIYPNEAELPGHSVENRRQSPAGRRQAGRRCCASPPSAFMPNGPDHPHRRQPRSIQRLSGAHRASTTHRNENKRTQAACHRIVPWLLPSPMSAFNGFYTARGRRNLGHSSANRAGLRSDPGSEPSMTRIVILFAGLGSGSEAANHPVRGSSGSSRSG